VRILLKLGIFLLIVHALYRIVPVYWKYYEFKEVIQDVAVHSTGKPNEEIVKRVLELAKAYEVPIERDGVNVRRQVGETRIETTWTRSVEVFPLYHYPWQFKLTVTVPDLSGPTPR
jgi:hypothetical protein